MKHIYVCSSKIDGLGLNIGENAKKGEVIARIKGEMKFKVNKGKKDALDNPDWIGIAKDQWIDPARPYKFLNHSCDASAGIKGRLSLVALRDMKEGDEITIDYSTIEGDALWEMKCACGSKKCRGIVRSIQYMPEDSYKHYLPYIPAYFRSLYERSKKQGELAKA